jgi:tetratricopeptide (TPR) repeat protein
MGEVFRCLDPDLGRGLAVKVLQLRHGENAGLVRRFVAEARLTGQLQHPGIPPVHEIGWLSDGRPFFSMKLVGGNTLAALLHGRSSPTEELPRFLNYFEQVCQAVAYAHSHGIIHRDLKPANVMVGKFGEVQVMDWGLAKALAGPPALPEGEAAPPEHAEQTRAGSIMGTPGFMPPEQARGDVDLVDERADVFGLGAILCVILTGSPPAPERATLSLEPEEDLAEGQARLGDCGAPPELVELASRCLATEREARPRNAGEVADAVARYQAAALEKTRRAEQERAAAEARAEEERKRYRLRLALGAVALVALVVIGTGAWLFERWRAQESTRRAELRAEFEIAQAEASARRERLSAELKLSRAQESARRERLRAEAAAIRSEALNRGRELLRAGRWPEALTVIGQARPLGGLEEGKDDEERLGLERLARLGAELDGAMTAVLFSPKDGTRQAERRLGRLLTEAGLVRHGEAEEVSAARMRALPIRTHLVAVLSRWADEDEANRDRAIQLAILLDDDKWRNKVREHWRNEEREEILSLAKAAQTRERPPASVRLLVEALYHFRLYAEGLALLQDVQPLYPGDLWLALHHGTFLNRLDREAEAIECTGAALALRPDVPGFWSNQAMLLRKVGRHREALMHHERAVALAPTMGMYWDNYGLSLSDVGRPVEAIKMHQKAISLSPNDAIAWTHLGFALSRARRNRESTEAFKYALSLDPTQVVARVNLGQNLRVAGQHERSLRQLELAVKQDPQFAVSRAAQGDTLAAMGRLKDAAEAYEAALKISPNFAKAHYHYAIVLEGLGRYREAIAHARANGAPTPAMQSAMLGRLFLKNRQPHVAVLFLREAVTRGARDVAVYAQLATALTRSGNVKEAITVAKKALDIEPKDVMSNSVLGHAYKNTEPARAIRHFLVVVPTHPGYDRAAYTLGYLYQESGDLARAEQHYRAAIKANPNHAEAHCNLGHVLRRRGRFREAVVSMRRGHELGSRLSGWDYESARWLAEVEALAALDRRLPSLLAGTSKPDGAKDAVAVARFCVRLGKNAEAVRFFKSAFALDAAVADNLHSGTRAEAAAASARAGDRKQALEWLRADLAGWKKLLEAGPATARPQLKQALQRWQKEPAFSPTKVPEGERKDWEAFFSDARALLGGEK